MMKTAVERTSVTKRAIGGLTGFVPRAARLERNAGKIPNARQAAVAIVYSNRVDFAKASVQEEETVAVFTS